MNIYSLLTVIESGRVARMHSIPTDRRQSVGEHTFNVLVLVYYLTNGTAAAPLLLAALFHDTPERETGDIPAHVKWDNPVIEEVLKELEKEFFTTHGLISKDLLSQGEQDILKAADLIDLYVYATEQSHKGERGFDVVKVRVRDALSRRLFDAPFRKNAIELLTHVDEYYSR